MWPQYTYFPLHVMCGAPSKPKMQKYCREQVHAKPPKVKWSEDVYVLDVCLNVLWDRRCVWSCPADSLPLTLSWHGRRSETAGAQAEGVYLPPPAAKEKRSTKEGSWMGSHWGSLPKVLYVGLPFKHGTFCLFLITAEAFGTYNENAWPYTLGLTGKEGKMQTVWHS